MGHTSQQRDQHRLCGAKKKNGEKCRKFAGEGTDHKGVGPCKYHLGNAPNVRKHAAKVRAQEEAQQFMEEHGFEFGKSVDIDPGDALLSALQLSYGHLMYIRSEIAVKKRSRTKAERFDRDVLLNRWDLERDRVARIAKACLDAGIAERRVRLAERYGVMLADMLRAVFGDPELMITDAQREMLPVVLRRHLLPVDAETPDYALLPPAASEPDNGRR